MGVGDIIAKKYYTMPESASVVQTHSNISKLKRSQIMSSDEWGLVEKEGDPARRSSGAAFLPLTESLKQVMSNENTGKSRFFKTLGRERKISSKNYSVQLRRGKGLLVRVIRRFEKMKVPEIGIPL